MTIFYAFATIYLFIGLINARQARIAPMRSGMRGLIGSLKATLNAGLCWPETALRRI